MKKLILFVVLAACAVGQNKPKAKLGAGTASACAAGVGGCSNVVAAIHPTAQANAVSAGTLVAAGSVGPGFYRVEGYISAASVCTSGQGYVQFTLNYTDEEGAQSLATNSLDLTVANVPVRFAFTFYTPGGTAISYVALELPGCAGGTYNLSAVVEQLTTS